MPRRTLKAAVVYKPHPDGEACEDAAIEAMADYFATLIIEKTQAATARLMGMDPGRLASLPRTIHYSNAHPLGPCAALREE